MSWTYSCPKCDSVVNPDETVMLIVAATGLQVLVGFHPKPGNYTIYTPKGFEMVRGARYEYFCPLCRQNLIARQKENLSALHLIQGNKKKTVLFSNIAGASETRVIDQ